MAFVLAADSLNITIVDSSSVPALHPLSQPPKEPIQLSASSSSPEPQSPPPPNTQLSSSSTQEGTRPPSTPLAKPPTGPSLPSSASLQRYRGFSGGYSHFLAAPHRPPVFYLRPELPPSLPPRASGVDNGRLGVAAICDVRVGYAIPATKADCTVKAVATVGVVNSGDCLCHGWEEDGDLRWDGRGWVWRRGRLRMDRGKAKEEKGRKGRQRDACRLRLMEGHGRLLRKRVERCLMPRAQHIRGQRKTCWLGACHLCVFGMRFTRWTCFWGSWFRWS